jgi:hypothetical protein
MINDRSSPRSRAACASRQRLAWPQGATAGLLIVAAACLAVSLTLYHVAGPRDVFAGETLTGR